MSIEYRALDTTIKTSGFFCGEAEIDKWFLKKALDSHIQRKHLVTCASFSNQPEKIIGFYALSTVVEEAKKLPGVKFFPFSSSLYFPCVQLVYMAIAKDLQRKDHGTDVLGEIVRVFAEVGGSIGVPAMILTPINDDAKRFYARLGFEPYDKGMRMVLPIQTAIATLKDAEDEVAEEETGEA